MPQLDAAVSRFAYFNTDGSVIQKAAAFEVNDPVLAKKIQDEPFFKVLP